MSEFSDKYELTLDIESYLDADRTLGPKGSDRFDEFHSRYPYIIIGRKAHYNWHEMHKWCQDRFGRDGYTWFGSKFHFANNDYLLDFCDEWMYDDEPISE